MGILRVKLKLVPKLFWMLIVTAVLSLILSSTGNFPQYLVETLYARRLYPHISALMSLMSPGALSWIDILIPMTVGGFLYLVYQRKFLYLLGFLSAGYLFFFWTWGLNYHRTPLASKLEFSAQRVDSESVAALAAEAATALNRLYALQNQRLGNDEELIANAQGRLNQVVAELDGTTEFTAPSVKSSRILNPFFRMAGVDGMFNPFGHEALVTTGLLDFEQPMVTLHELAHVRGYPDEGDANFVALMAAVNSNDVALQYSGWLTLWLYLRSAERDPLLEDGPRQDVQAIYGRIMANRVDWFSRLQTRSLDLFLKAHDVEEGVNSYAKIVSLAVGTRPSWGRFSE